MDKSITNDMKKRNTLWMIAAMFIVAMTGLVGCTKTYKILLDTQDLWFGLDAGTQTLEIDANCEWFITKNDDADWYTLSTMEGKKDATITVTVEALEDADFRGSSFVINSPGGHVHRTVFISQNKLDFDGMVNKIFGVMSVEHWNTDYYGMIIEDSYRAYTYDPYDTTSGYLMYFLEGGRGYQRDHHTDTVAWWGFTYNFDVVNQILNISFETVDGSPESYSPAVLTASDSLYRIFHEYKDNFWERADMRKVGTIDPGEKEGMMRKAAKRKEGQPMFMTE